MANGRVSLVIDASVAIKWRLDDEELVSEAMLLLDRLEAGDIVLGAPRFIRYEVANSLEQARRRGRLTQDGVLASLQYYFALGIAADDDDDETVRLASRIAGQFATSVYDALYVAYAELAGCAMITNDRRLLRQVQEYPIAVHHLSEVASLL